MQEWLPNDGNQNITQGTYKKQNVSEINDIVEFPEGTFFLYTTDQHQRKYPSLLAKYLKSTYKTGSSCKESNMYFNIITCDDKTCIAFILKSYV